MSAPETNIPGEDVSYMIYVPVAVFGVICPVIVGLRVWLRLLNGGRLGADDYCIIGSLVTSLGSGGIMIVSCLYGYGRHWNNLTAYNRVHAYMWFFICQTTYKWSISATKCSILLLYLRIFNNIRWLKLTCWSLITTVTVYCIVASFVSVFQCTPLQRAYDKSIPGHCIDNTKNWYANAGFSISTDIIILLLPLPMVWALQVPITQKVALAFIFTLGIFVVFTSCMRVGTLNITATTPDVTFDIASTMWSMIEMNVAIVCACLPMMRVFIVRVFPRLFSSASGANKSEASASFSTGKHATRPKGYLISSGYPDNEHSAWRHTDTKGSIALESIRQRDQGSEDYILSQTQVYDTHEGVENTIAVGRSGDLESHPGIHKTVHYSVKYSSKEQEK